MNRIALAAPAALGLALATLAGCATTGEPSRDRITGECKPEPGQAFVGQTASAEVGAQLLKATGAARLRWGPPRSAMTMDYRPDRLTVSYDDDLVIDRVSCG